MATFVHIMNEAEQQDKEMTYAYRQNRKKREKGTPAFLKKKAIITWYVGDQF